MATSGPPRVSTADAVGEAIEVTGRRLFPFDANRWILLGFVAFLDQCGRRGGSPGFQVPGGGGPSGGPGGPDPAQWIRDNLAVIVIVAAGLLLLGLAIGALATWLSSRGIFMYVDSVARGRTELTRAWAEHAAPANSLFLWRFLAGVAALLLVLFLVGVPAFVIAADGFTGLAVALAIAGGSGALAVALASSLLAVALRDFAAPIQVHDRTPCGPALRRVGVLVAAHPLSFGGYVLLKMLLAILTGMLSYFACCLTCCVGILPVIHQTFLQPVFYFERAWSLCLLRQMGIDVFGPEEEGASVL